jgi:hypothetical protein
VLNADGAIDKQTKKSAGGAMLETLDYEYLGERLRWVDNGQTRAVYRYDDFGNVVRITQQAQVDGVYPKPDETALDPKVCPEVPQDGDVKATYYCYDEFERLIFSKGQSVNNPAEYAYDGLDRRDSSADTETGTRRSRD